MTSINGISAIFIPQTNFGSRIFKNCRALCRCSKDLKNGFLDSAQSLLSALQRIDDASLLCERLYVYAKMRRDEDNANGKYQGMTDRAMSLYVAVSGETSFVAPALLSESEEKLESYISGETGLEPYTFMIRDIIRQKKHVLSENEEKLLSIEPPTLRRAHATFSRCSTTTILNSARFKRRTARLS